MFKLLASYPQLLVHPEVENHNEGHQLPNIL